MGGVLVTLTAAGKALGDEPAYPVDADRHDGIGMTKREAFAMAAMQGAMASSLGLESGLYDTLTAVDIMLNLLAGGETDD